MSKTLEGAEEGPGTAGRRAISTPAWPPSRGRRPLARTWRSRLGAALAAALVASACSLPGLPRLRERPTFPPLPQTSVILDHRGRLITRLHAGEHRVVIPLSEVPQVTRDAVIAVEDRRFYAHRGVDLKALIRAGLANARTGRIVQGGSTITEQLVKNTITGGERTLDRKLREAMLAYQLEHELSKDRILELYLNTVYFGQGAYGIQAAARTYFSVPARRLTLAQSALLAGLIASPSTYDPTLYPEAALARRNLVLRRMLEAGMVDPLTYQRARATDLDLRPSSSLRDRYPAPYFVDYVKQWFLDNPRFGETREERYDLLFKGGLRIHTTVDLDLQRLAERAVAGILIRKTDPYAAMTVIDPRSGQIRAMVGGRDYFASRREDPVAKVNLATGRKVGTGYQAYAQAGSAFKPFALVAALRQGVPPQRRYAAPGHIDIPLPGPGPQRVWAVDNYDGTSQGVLDLERATILSSNTVYAQLIMDIGPDSVVRTAHDMGITSRLRAYPSAVLGTNEVNTLEMASAYGTLATLGKRVPPVAVTRITDARGRVLFEHRPRPREVIEPAVAWTTVQILRKVVQEGTGTAANIGRPVAGKTGTAQGWTHAWFVGFTPQLVAAVWVGFPRQPRSMVYPAVRVARVTGGSWPAQIWRAFMVNATRNLPPLDFPHPDGSYVSVRVDVTRHCLPNRWTLPEDIRTVSFAAGTEPTRTCRRPSGPQPVPVPSVVGMSASEARRALSAYAFEVELRVVASRSGPPDTVLSQDPPAGTVALQGTRVTLRATEPGPQPDPGPPAPPATSPYPPGTVPPVVGLGAEEARSRLLGAGYAVSVVNEWVCWPPEPCRAVAGTVWSQDPPAGTPLMPPSTVTIRVNPS